MYKKSDLKPGMAVQLVNGQLYYVVNNEVMIDSNEEQRFLSRYDENLLVIGNRHSDVLPWDVAGIYEYSADVKDWVLVPESKSYSDYDEILGSFFVRIDGRKTTVTTIWGEHVTTCLLGDPYDERKGVSIALLKARRAMFKYYLSQTEKNLAELKK